MSDKRPKLIAQRRFEEHQTEITQLGLGERFQYIYEQNLWGSEESRSGLGSTMLETAVLRTQIVALLAKLDAKSLLDIPCGDFHWLSKVDLGVESYTGADIVAAIVERNRALYGSAGRSFERMDLTGTSEADRLPRADVVLCRDCLVHLSFDNIWSSIENIRRSESRYLLTTHFFELAANEDIEDGDWRPLNFECAPFHFPAPSELIVENCVEGEGAYRDKALALWPVSALPKRH